MRYVRTKDGDIGLLYTKSGKKCFLKLRDNAEWAEVHVSLHEDVDLRDVATVSSDLIVRVLQENSSLMRDGQRLRDLVRAAAKALDSSLMEAVGMTSEFVGDGLRRILKGD